MTRPEFEDGTRNTVQMSDELLRLLADDWSGPVELKAVRIPGYPHWELTARTHECEKRS